MIMELTTSALLLANTLTMMNVIPIASAATTPTVNSSDVAVTVQVAPPTSFRDYVETYFSDVPVLVDIAKCESDFRQYDKDGSVLRGVANRYDVGVMQINEKYQLERAERLGYDIYSAEGNLAYARYLYGKEGTKPWQSSEKCWKQSVADIANK